MESGNLGQDLIAESRRRLPAGGDVDRGRGVTSVTGR